MIPFNEFYLFDTESQEKNLLANALDIEFSYRINNHFERDLSGSAFSLNADEKKFLFSLKGKGELHLFSKKFSFISTSLIFEREKWKGKQAKLDFLKDSTKVIPLFDCLLVDFKKYKNYWVLDLVQL